MSIWKEIKYALNKSLGTKDFKPLDELIIQQTKMVVSDDVYETFEDWEFAVPPEEGITKTYPIQLSMTRYGEMQLIGDMYRSNEVWGRAVLRVYHNDAEIYSLSKNAGSGENSTSFNITINFKPNDKIRLELYGKNTRSSLYDYDFGIHNLKTLGTLKETAYLNEYITE